MLLYVYGGDGYRRGRALREQIIPAYVAKHSDAALSYFYGDETDIYDRLRAFTQNVSLFASVALGVLYAPEALAKDSLTLLKKLVDSQTASLVVVAEKKLPKKDFGFLYTEKVKAFEYEVLAGAAWLSFVKQEAVTRGAKLSDVEIRALATAHAGDSFAVVTELEKVGLGGELALGAVKSDFFGLIKSFRYGRSFREKISALDELLEGGGAPGAFNMFARFTDGALRSRMAEYDILIKSGKLDYAEALFDLILS